MNRPPTDSICSAADLRTSEAYTTAPSLFAVAIAWSPATPDPMITNFEGRTVPALVVIIGMPLGTWAAPSNTALYPDRLSWLEFTSMACARERRLGIISILIRVIPASTHSFTEEGFLNGSATQAIIWPCFKLDVSGIDIDTTTSQDNASSRLETVPPAAS